MTTTTRSVLPVVGKGQALYDVARRRGRRFAGAATRRQRVQLVRIGRRYTRSKQGCGRLVNDSHNQQLCYLVSNSNLKTILNNRSNTQTKPPIWINAGEGLV